MEILTLASSAVEFVTGGEWENVVLRLVAHQDACEVGVPLVPLSYCCWICLVDAVRIDVRS